MGEVYLATHPRLPRHDALKALPTELTGDAEFRQRFIREADLAATLFHPHIVGVHDRGEYDDQLWISMDYIDGTDAAQFVRELYPAGMHADEVLAVVSAIGSALRACLHTLQCGSHYGARSRIWATGRAHRRRFVKTFWFNTFRFT